MPHINQMTIQCSNCAQPIPAQVRSYIDATEDPQGKALILNGRLNANQCPNCGAINNVMASILYHDPTKELLVAHVPMELNMDNDQQERVIGNMMNTLPKENFKAYMFSPKRALTMKALVEMILEADGVTPEMMQAQEKRIQLAQDIVNTPDTERPAFIAEHDSEIDDELLRSLALIAQRLIEEGRPEAAQKVLVVQSEVAQLSTAGQAILQKQRDQEEVVREVASEIESIGEGANRQAFYELAVRFIDDENRLQALIGLARPAFDYEFLQDMNVKIGEAPADERDALTGLRDRIVELTSAIDEQSQMAMRNAAGFLQAVINAPNPDEILQANLHVIDDMFMQVLVANIQEAERRKDLQSAVKLKEIYSKVMALLQSQMQPELVFVNELLSTENDEQAKTMIAERAPEFGDGLLEVIDAVDQVLASQGNQPMQARLDGFRKEVVTVLN